MSSSNKAGIKKATLIEKAVSASMKEMKMTRTVVHREKPGNEWKIKESGSLASAGEKGGRVLRNSKHSEKEGAAKRPVSPLVDTKEKPAFAKSHSSIKTYKGKRPPLSLSPTSTSSTSSSFVYKDDKTITVNNEDEDVDRSKTGGPGTSGAWQNDQNKGLGEPRTPQGSPRVEKATGYNEKTKKRQHQLGTGEDGPDTSLSSNEKRDKPPQGPAKKRARKDDETATVPTPKPEGLLIEYSKLRGGGHRDRLPQKTSPHVNLEPLPAPILRLPKLPDHLPSSHKTTPAPPPPTPTPVDYSVSNSEIIDLSLSQPTSEQVTPILQSVSLSTQAGQCHQ